MQTATAEKANVIEFPDRFAVRKPGLKRKQRSANDGFKYLTESDIKRLRREVRDAAVLAEQRVQCTAVRDWAAIDTLTCAGLREAELAALRCGDIRGGYGESEIRVRHGKGDKSRTVQVPQACKTHLMHFLAWKAQRGEPTGADDPVFVGQRGQWTPQAVAQCVKKWLKQLGLYERGKSAHSLRHSYAVEYYRNTHDLRGLQKQLGHSKIQTTTIYADVLKEDIQDNIKGLWN